jgi:protein associated with RNAse G/E
MLEKANIRKMLVSGDQWGAWQGYQLPVSDTYVCIWTPIGTPMHWKPGTWISEKHTLFFFWPGAWYTIHISYGQDGGFAGVYCDVVLPTPTYTSAAQDLTYIDLYIDVVIRGDYSVYTKDHAVFERAAQHYPIVEQSRQKAFEVLDWVETQAKNWSGPFACIPRNLARTDLEQLSGEEARAVLRAALQADRQ